MMPKEIERGVHVKAVLGITSRRIGKKDSGASTGATQEWYRWPSISLKKVYPLNLTTHILIAPKARRLGWQSQLQETAEKLGLASQHYQDAREAGHALLGIENKWEVIKSY